MYDYDAYVAKCRCIIGRLLTGEDYARLCAAQSVQGAAALLRGMPAYTDFVGDVDGVLNRSLLEAELEEARFAVYERLYRFTQGALQNFIRAMMREFEIYHLLSAIRSVKSGNAATQRQLPPFLAERSSLNFGRLFSATSLDELIEALGKHPFGAIVAASVEGGHCDIARLEMALYNAHQVALFDQVAPMLDNANRDALRRFLGIRADLTNISRLLRLRTLAGLQGSEPPTMATLLPLLIPLSGRLREGDLAAMLALPDEAAIRAYCAGIYGSDAAIFTADTTGVDTFAQLTYNYARRLIASPDAPISVSLGCFTLHRLEIDNIIYIIEGIRYGLPAEAIEKRLVR